jgi:hypothetical protein
VYDFSNEGDLIGTINTNEIISNLVLPDKSIISQENIQSYMHPKSRTGFGLIHIYADKVVIKENGKMRTFNAPTELSAYIVPYHDGAIIFSRSQRKVFYISPKGEWKVILEGNKLGYIERSIVSDNKLLLKADNKTLVILDLESGSINTISTNTGIQSAAIFHVRKAELEKTVHLHLDKYIPSAIVNIIYNYI